MKGKVKEMSRDNEIIEVLMKRDGISRKEAQNQYKETARLINEAIAMGEVWDVEEILACELGLELDYIFDFI